MKTSIEVKLSEDEPEELLRRARGLLVAHREVVRAKMILRLADGASIRQIAREVGRRRRIVHKWALSGS